MKQLVLALLCVCMFPLSNYAQTYDSYKLDKYVNPTYKRKSLDFNFGLSGDMTSNKSTDGDINRDDQSGSGTLQAKYNQIRNNEKLQSKMNGFFKMYGQLGHHKREENSLLSTQNAKARHLILELEFNRDAFYYFNTTKKLFFEASPDINLKYNWHRSKDVDDLEDSYKNNLLQFNALVKFAIGKGRIEQVEDARQAIYILEGLRKNGIIVNKLTDDEVNEFAKIITLAKNKRQFDSRIKLIEEIAKVDSFLVANNYVEEKNGAAYYTSIYDNWQYAGLIERQSGTRISGGIQPFFYYSYSHRTDHTYNYKDISSLIGGVVYGEIKHEKPTSLYWQRSAGANVLLYTKHMRNFIHSPYASVAAYYGLGYYPNSRTYITGRLSQDLVWFDGPDSFSSLSKLDFKLYYYLSPQLRLSVNYLLKYSFFKDINDNYKVYTKYPDNLFSAALTYSFF